MLAEFFVRGAGWGIALVSLRLGDNLLAIEQAFTNLGLGRFD